MIVALFSRILTVLFGTVYPAYASYKALRTKCLKKYVKWMMYWIMYAMFICIESVTDIFLTWLPNYYLLKFIIILWLLSPGIGSSTIYRKFIHPAIRRRELAIDKNVNQAKSFGYEIILNLSLKCGRCIGKMLKQAVSTLEYNVGVSIDKQQLPTLESLSELLLKNYSTNSQLITQQLFKNNNMAYDNVATDPISSNVPQSECHLSATIVKGEVNEIANEIDDISNPVEQNRFNNVDNVIKKPSEENPVEVKIGPENGAAINIIKLRLLTLRKVNMKWSQLKSAELKLPYSSRINTLKLCGGNRAIRTGLKSD